MSIDLNSPSEFTIDNIASLLASKDDSKNRQLRVTTAGIAFLSDDVGNQNVAGLAFRFETFCSGNDYVGVKAAQDKKWVERIYNALRKNWPENKCGSYLDVF